MKLVPGMDMDKAGESSPAMASLLPRIMSAGIKTRQVLWTAHGGEVLGVKLLRFL